MADTFTTNYNWTKPAVGGDPDTWGGLLNTDLDGIDSTVFAVSGVANAAMPKSGGTFSGAVTVNNATALGPTSGSTWIPLVISQSAGANADSVSLVHFRNGAGSDWTTALWQLYRQVDSSKHAFIQWEDATGSAGMLFGTGSTVAGSFNGAGAWTFNTAVTMNNTLGVSGNITSTSGNITAGGNMISNGGNVQAGSTSGSYTNLAFSGTISTNRTINPTVSAGLALTVTGQYGGGVCWNDPTGGSNWGIYTSSGTLVFGYNAGSGALATKSTLSNGGVWSATDFTATSDARLKDNRQPLAAGYEELKQCFPEEYDKYDAEGNFLQREAGFIAQEVQKVLGSAVSEGDDGFLRVSHGQVLAMVARAVLDIGRALELEGIL